MHATHPVRRLHPLRDELAILVVIAIVVAAIVAASVVPSLGRLGAGAGPGAHPGPILNAEPAARDGSAGSDPRISR